jgi:hypothetical protein
MFIGGDQSVACIIEHDDPIISRKSCVIDVLLSEDRRQGKVDELWRISKLYSQSMDVDELKQYLGVSQHR